MINNNIKVIVFDLDGTLYEDTHHFDYYVKKIKEQLPEKEQNAFAEEYAQFMNDNHTLKIGRIYDVQEDLIIDQVKDKIKNVFTWEGNVLADSEVKKLYPEAVPIDMERFFSIGDMWWVPNALARHYGLERSHTQDAFLKTREHMMTEAFKMNPVPGFSNCLESLKDKVNLVLMTNSPEPDSRVILEKLGLSNVFKKLVFNAKKPTATNDHFLDFKETFNVSYNEILSVGDNYLNEILPANLLGCSTIYIDPHSTLVDRSSEIVVKSITEVIPMIEKLGK
ncbi:HAD family hydrolase [Serpentinicella sp. ANB-PHB4]|uniref:HAD family hydrolase n=1 Tax=Serpentinicella sp. ANB-PHB4 TaxID=3074076 RepID=UPI002859AD81|nr:HAD family hydrolase [Serpentinicella sp. ANB-PHB4]MDR5659735.1 HAD family hydrolase [Serpentinicella sp. ANB-PHB4]